MKKILNLCLALCLLCGLNGVHSVSAEEGQTVDDEIIKCDEQGIPDSALYAEVLEAGDGNKDGVLTKAEAEGIKSLYANDDEIANLQGIEKLMNLTDLSLNSENITDLKEIENLTKLTSLSLSGKKITDLKGIENLTNLTDLDLNRTGITSLQGIEKLTNLTSLSLDETKITSLQGIENLTNLTSLNLWRTSITSIKGIENLTNLTHLNLSDTGITSLQGIEKLTNLTLLYLSNTGITSIKGIENLTNLTHLNLDRTDITSIKGIENLTNLTQLYLNYTDITSVQGIENLVNLTDLSLSHTDITSIKGIEKLTNLNRLDVEDTRIDNLHGIENLTKLSDLHISYNDLTELPDLSNLVNLNLTRSLIKGNKITTDELKAKLPKHILDKYKGKEAIISQREITLKVNEPLYYHDTCISHYDENWCKNFVDKRGLKIGYKDDTGKINYNGHVSAYTEDWNIVMTGMVWGRDSYPFGMNTEHEDYEAFDKAMKEYWSTSNSKYLGYDNDHDLKMSLIRKNNLNSDDLFLGWGAAGRTTEALVPIRTGSTYVIFSVGYYTVKVKVNVVDDTDDNNADKPSVDENKPKYENVNSDNGIPTDTSDRLHDDKVLGMTINMPNSDTATADIFQALKETGKNLTFNVKGENDRTKYSWTFKGNDIKNPDMDLDLSINFETEKQQEIQNITNQSNMFYVSFVHHGELPGTAKIKVDVSDKFKDGDYIYLYYYNEEKGTIERKGSGYEVKDGYAEFEINHCSVYFFTKEPATVPVNKDDKTNTNTKEPVKTDSKKDGNMIKNTATDGSQSNASAIVLAVMVLGLLGFVVIKNKATE